MPFLFLLLMDKHKPQEWCTMWLCGLSCICRNYELIDKRAVKWGCALELSPTGDDEMFLSALALSKGRGSWRLCQYVMSLLHVSLLFVSSLLLIDTCRSSCSSLQSFCLGSSCPLVGRYWPISSTYKTINLMIILVFFYRIYFINTSAFMIYMEVSCILKHTTLLQLCLFLSWSSSFGMCLGSRENS